MLQILSNKLIRILSIGLLVLFLFNIPENSWGLTGADIGIYNDTSFPGGGAWAEGLTAIKAMLDTYGYTHEDITPTDINSSSLNLSSLYRMVIFGGGWAGGYNASVREAGFNNLRNFVADGGGYFGICAGAYFASDIIMWKPDWLAPIEVYNYPLNLFNGLGLGAAVSIKEWNASTGCTSGITKGAAMTSIKIDNSVLPGIDTVLNILYYGGPAFFPNPFSPISGYSVAATYTLPGDLLDGTPAMITYNYGNGKVFLSGPHPEVSFSNCSLSYDNATWKLMKSVISMLTGLQ